MQNYLKSALPCHGCTAPVARGIFATVLNKDVVFADGASWAVAVATIWDGAQYREERYAALHLARTAPAAQHWRLDPAITLPLVRELVRAGSWWDYVDDLSSHHLCDLFVAHPVVVGAELTRWSQGDVLWLRRAAICAQLSCKGAQLDWPFLQRMILPAMSSETFWLRKAIGWSLRQAARERPDDVKLFVRTHYDQLSALSRKEALKHLGGDKGGRGGRAGQPKLSSTKGKAAAAAAAAAAEMEDDGDVDVDPTDAADPEAAVARSDAAEASAAAAAAGVAVPAPARGRKRTQSAAK
jgi:3-methyladenine DNA glycosylase AlkD